ncbi:sugar ABC transporter permease [Actinocorallia sp. API 0066]|uniref:carbohydrate ABC transporter permease n=1 Tax=Actinocorallia sp. API 0066 TaxID=2896846 RepID=UPI001E5FDE88|nr:sugar ABC transporter permease [Actinocorallia sp. API 0066]MCD0453773.1 sugar ABC transporter permease [Actinocorallia sp. API 0066]
MKQNRPLARAVTWFDLKAAPYVLISPYFLLFAVFGLFPLGFTVWVSLHDWELAGDRAWLGFTNYTELLVDADFWNAVVNTLGMFVLATIPQLLLALVLANALNKRMRFRLLYRLGVLVPMVTSIVAVAVVFGQLFARDHGAFNWLLGTDGLDWQADKLTSWTAISVMVDWRWTGYNALIYLAAMQAIPRDLYEAAAIDGASPRRQFWRITVPMLRPAIIFTALTSTIGGLSLFTEPVMFAQGDVGGGSLGQFQTVAMYMYESAFRDRDYGYASAVAWMLFLLILLVSLVSFLFTRRIGGTK